MNKVMGDLIIDNFRNMIVWVLKDNPSRYFYENLGGQQIGQETVEIGGEYFEEIAYKIPLHAASIG
ncbi:hypothetical protein [Bacillus sp. M6-12]|uniref:hypothetical protein n=1 Tax=Bacillus sp. M6-12 TaxID=2054166 RepID=UPI002155EC12|nr:hypothetical protein [Bacillus sp. M6-12]